MPTTASIKFSNGSTIQHTFQPTEPRTHNPLLLSMVAGSHMHNCNQIKELFQECQDEEQCQDSKDKSALCEAAQQFSTFCKNDLNAVNSVPYHE